ncbi:hypothetical protein MTO96_001700 [Rhipicephalus appendiculatus]
MAAIRFNHMNPSELHHCLEYPGVAEMEPVKKIVLDAIYSWVASESGAKDIDKKNARHYTPLQECSNVSVTVENDDLPSNSVMPTSPDPTSGTHTTSDRSLADKPTYRPGGAFLVLKDSIKSTPSANTLGASQGDDRDHMSASYAGPTFRGSSSSFLHGQSVGGSARNVASGLGDSSGSYIEETQERRVVESRTEEVRTVRKIRRSRSRNQAGSEPLAIEDSVWYRTQSGHRAVRPGGLPPITSGECAVSRSMISGPGRTVTESRQSNDERTETENVSERAMSTSYASSQYSFGEVASADRMRLLEGTTPLAEDVSPVASARPSTVSVGEIGAFSDRADSAAKPVSSTSSMYSLSAEEQDLHALAPWKPAITDNAARKESSGFESRASDKGGSEKSFPAASAESIEVSDYKTIYGKSQSEEKQDKEELETIDEAPTVASLTSDAREEPTQATQMAEPCTELIPMDLPKELQELCDVHLAAEIRRRSSGSMHGEKPKEEPLTTAKRKEKRGSTQVVETDKEKLSLGPPIATLGDVQRKRGSKDSLNRKRIDVKTGAAGQEKTVSELGRVQPKQAPLLGVFEIKVDEEMASYEQKHLPPKKAEQSGASGSAALAQPTEAASIKARVRKDAAMGRPLGTAAGIEHRTPREDKTSGPTLSVPELEKPRDIVEATDDGCKLVLLPQKRQEAKQKSASDNVASVKAWIHKDAAMGQPLGTAADIEHRTSRKDKTNGPTLMEKPRDIVETTDDGCKLVLLPQKRQEAKQKSASDNVASVKAWIHKEAAVGQPLGIAAGIEHRTPREDETSGPAFSVPELEKLRDIEETTDDGYKLVFLPQKRQEVEQKSSSDNESEELPYLEVESPESTDSGKSDNANLPVPDGHEADHDSVLGGNYNAWRFERPVRSLSRRTSH